MTSGNKPHLSAPIPITDGDSRANGWVEIPTSPYMPADPNQRWLVQTDEGEFQLVEGERELAELLRMGRVSGRTPVYPVGDGPRPLGEIPEIARLMSMAASSEPPIRRDQRSSERATLSEELAVLNRPLDEEVEYYDEARIRRWPRRLAFVVAFAAATMGAYLFVLPRFPTARSFVLTRLIHPARSLGVVATSAPAPASQMPAAIAGTSAAVSVPLAAATVQPLQVAAPQAGPGTPSAPPAPSPDAAESAAGPSVVEHQARAPETHKPSHSMRHRTARKRSSSKR